MAKILSRSPLFENIHDRQGDALGMQRGLMQAALSGPNAISGPVAPQAVLPPFSGTILLASLGTDGFKISGAAAEDQLGFDVSSAGDVNGDNIEDFAIGARLDDGGGTDAGASYVIFGKVGGYASVNLAALAATDGFKILGDAAGDQASQISSAGDYNGDGFDDIIVGAAGNDSGGSNAGAAYLLFGKASGFATIDLAAITAADGFKIQGDSSSDATGSSVDHADVNDDGFDDLLVGTPNESATYVIFGKATGFGPVDLTGLALAAGFKIQGSGSAGASVSSAGDFNGDGIEDMIIGAPTDTQAGSAYIIFGKTSGWASLNLASISSNDGFKIRGEPTSLIGSLANNTGLSVASAGDINADGFDDVIVGAYGDDQAGGDAGAAYVIFGKATGFSMVDLANFGPETGFKIISERGSPPDQMGFSVSGAGDVNGDGFADLLVGAPRNDAGHDPTFENPDIGATYLLFGRASGFIDIDLRQVLVPADGIRIFGETQGDLSGISVAGAGDVNNDGADDVIIGATLHDAGGNSTGAAYVVYGRTGIGGPQIIGGAGNDVLFGTGGTDDLRGLGGNDYLEAFGGGDRLDGGPGNDVLAVDEARDVAVEAPGEGYDTLYTSVSYTLNRGSEIEVLAARDNQLTDPLTLIGNGFANLVMGNNGNNIIDGGGGGDVLVGFGGDDTYTLRTAADVVIDSTGGGFDTVFTSFDFTIADSQEIERVSALSTSSTTALNLIGNDLDNILIGNNGNNILLGGGGNDTLQSMGAQSGGDFLDGGTGADIVQLGFGSHIVVVDNLGDVVTGSGSNDTIFATASYALAAGFAVSKLSAIDHLLTNAMDLTGNELGNTILGNNGNNIIDGGGGADALAGFGGDDVYGVDNAADQVFEGTGSGNDIVYASASFALGAGQAVETLAARDNSLTTALALIGNELANTVLGNSGANFIDGGAGADVLAGYGGDDIYAVDNAADLVFEGVGSGSDIVYTSVSYTLGAGQAVETLAARDISLTTALNLTGNELANTVRGNSGANTIDGGGAADVLVGYGGNDTFSFTTALGGGNVDYIVDFASGSDKIALDDAVFTGLGLGSLPASAFVTGTAAQDADDRIIYNSATGQLFYDADGNGAGAAIQFATLQGAPVLSASDFVVI